ncbi:non-ribosomal peptide synthetase [Streptomyces sp. ERV7]|uniref:non-ribosomal peptide synthetase n=1 Tax=Streptomyces sp. ERV7 TaxID=1322334 RepID=UPI00131E1E0E|nr:non-ribosomal peptide synthetase [Streptomyces sp. ERV7]
MLDEQAAERGTATALSTPAGGRVSYQELAAQVRQAARQLTAALGSGQRILVPMANTPESVVAVLAAMTAGVAVPVNPDATASERAAIAAKARPAAVFLPTAAASGWTNGPQRQLVLGRLPTEPADTSDKQRPAADDLALLMGTSGTAAGPRLVAFTHRQWLECACRVVHEFGLTESDRTLNLMPLFHNHGLNGAVLASIYVGGQVMCPGPADMEHVVTWLAEAAPTWLTCAPTVHAMLLDAVKSEQESTSSAGLRFLRTASAPMSATLWARLEETFGVPVLNAWGMTETGQVTATPLPPGLRKPGSVGVVRHGFEVVVRDEDGAPCAPGVTGEILLKGPLAYSGYFGDPSEAATLLENGWLHTKDLGRIDDDGYLWIEGRNADFANRGGSKIWLPDIDAACAAHPDIDSALAFAVPHPRLGQDAVVAVVLRAGAATTAEALHGFLSSTLPAESVPRRIEILPEMPGSPTGKPQRRLLQERFGNHPTPSRRDTRPRRSTVVMEIAALWCEALDLERVGEDEDFLASGGDSLLATWLTAKVAKTLGVDLPVSALFDEANTVARMAALVEAARGA